MTIKSICDSERDPSQSPDGAQRPTEAAVDRLAELLPADALEAALKASIPMTSRRRAAADAARGPSDRDGARHRADRASRASAGRRGAGPERSQRRRAQDAQHRSGIGRGPHAARPRRQLRAQARGHAPDQVWPAFGTVIARARPQPAALDQHSRPPPPDSSAPPATLRRRLLALSGPPTRTALGHVWERDGRVAQRTQVAAAVEPEAGVVGSAGAARRACVGDVDEMAVYGDADRVGAVGGDRPATDSLPANRRA
jgi:hypothetical protein